MLLYLTSGAELGREGDSGILGDLGHSRPLESIAGGHEYFRGRAVCNASDRRLAFIRELWHDARLRPARGQHVVRHFVPVAQPRQGGIGISAITLWELAWLATHGRLEITGTADVFVEKITSRTAVRPITARIAVLANQLPATYSSDPCDQLIGATALAEGIPLITKDKKIRDCRQIQTIW